MLGEGMPWHIILTFFAIGLLMGLISARMGREKGAK